MSTTIIGDVPAFPSEQHQTDDGSWNKTFDSGMTYRMWLIGKIAIGHAANSHFAKIELDNKALVDMTVAFADAIIERLDKEMGES